MGIFKVSEWFLTGLAIICMIVVIGGILGILIFFLKKHMKWRKKIINQEEEHCNVGDVILNSCIVEKVDDPKDYTYELKIAGGELLGNAISMSWYTNRINEVIDKYNI